MDKKQDGTAILITKKGIMDREAAFSFKWFIPTILKFKKEFIPVHYKKSGISLQLPAQITFCAIMVM